MKKKKKGSLFDIILFVAMIAVAVITLFPFLTVVAKSVSDARYVLSGSVGVIPKGFQLDTIKFVLSRPEFRSAFAVSVAETLIGTAIAMILTVLAAYPLSKPKLKGRKACLYFFVFIMLFNAGMVPKYLLYRSLKLTNTIWALILPSALSVSNMLIVKNYFETLPEAIEEAAMIDGASTMQTLFHVVLPMSKPVLATITLFYAVGYWNDYFNGVMYITDPNMRSLQHYIYDLLTVTKDASSLADNLGNIEALAAISSEGIRCATILLSTIPILIVYPRLQKYFVKGITIGSVKG